MNEPDFEARLRAALRARDPGASPPALEARLASSLTSRGSSSWLGRLRSAAMPLAAAAVVVFVAVLAARPWLGLPDGVGPAATPIPEAVDPWTLRAGFSGPRWPLDLWPEIAVMAPSYVLAALIWRRAERRDARLQGWRRQVSAVASLAIIVLTLGVSDLTVGSWRHPVDLVGTRPGVGAFERRDGRVVYPVGTDSRISFVIRVTNHGAVPVRLMGTLVDDRDPTFGLRALEIVGLARPSRVGWTGADPVLPFDEPLVEPGRTVEIVVLAITLGCASIDPEGPTIDHSRMSLVTEFIGSRQVGDYRLDPPVRVPRC